MITGQAIYELCQEQEPLSCPWKFINEQKYYDVLAEKLNAQYLVPLQGLVQEQEKKSKALDELYVGLQADIQFIEIAYQREVDALKAVLTSFRVLVECVEVPVSWQEERSKLLRLTTQLLDGEQKVG